MHCVGFEVRIPTPPLARLLWRGSSLWVHHPSVFSLEYSSGGEGEEEAKTIPTADFSEGTNRKNGGWQEGEEEEEDTHQQDM